MTTTISILEPLSNWWGVDPADVVRDIQDVAADDPIHVVINCPGGDLFGALAIRNALAAHPAALSIEVIGLAASGGSLIMAIDRADVTMRIGTWAMIHDPMTCVVGNAADMRETADLLDRMAIDMARMYATRMGQDEKEIRDLMAAETWYNAQEAVACGLCDDTDEDGGEVAAQSEQSLRLLSSYRKRPAYPESPSPSIPSDRSELEALLADLKAM